MLAKIERILTYRAFKVEIPVKNVLFANHCQMIGDLKGPY